MRAIATHEFHRSKPRTRCAPPAATDPAFTGSVGLIILLLFWSLPTAETTALLLCQIEIKIKIISYHVLL